jgi:hypothetical protein
MRVSRVAFPKPASPAGLRDELLAAGVPVRLVNLVAGGVEVDVPDEWDDAAAAIVAAHNAAAYDAAQATERTQFAQDVANVKQYMGLSAPVAEQRRLSFEKALARILRRVVSELRD